MTARSADDEGSSPSAATNTPRSSKGRTAGFGPANRGSNPWRGTLSWRNWIARPASNRKVVGSSPTERATSASAWARLGLQNRRQQVRLLPPVPSRLTAVDHHTALLMPFTDAPQCVSTRPPRDQHSVVERLLGDTCHVRDHFCVGQSRWLCRANEIKRRWVRACRRDGLLAAT